MEWAFCVLVIGIVAVAIWHCVSEHRHMKRLRETMDRMHHDATTNWIRSLPRYDDRFFARPLRNTLRASWEPTLHNWKDEGF